MIPSIDIGAPAKLGFGRAAIAVTCVLALALAGCSGKKKDQAATQTAAKVNKEEITVHQINFVLQQQRGLSPAQAASASHQVLERLIDQELAVQKAKDQDLDRDPRVVQQIEAAKREIIAHAYREHIGAGASKPTPEEIKAYYASKPALFKERRIYNVQELRVDATPAQVEELRARLQASPSGADLIAYLKANDYKFGGNQSILPAEQVPMSALDAFAGMKDGQAMLNPIPNGAQVFIVVSSRSQPIDEAQAATAIENFLMVERRRKLVEDDLKALRSAARIQYLGDYAKAEAAPAKSP
ncbi:MAG TPA: EpsD family peptidyl-prolyl cis-trans isomerase [Albitalea sp.]|nr:EpsD family peptidyl-prolyl cis-trans isomerase [Albitalea sp.]